MRYALIMFLSLKVLGCENRDLVLDSPASFPGVLDLRVGQSVRLPRGGFSVTFEKVTQDSRCPTGAMCVWAGDAGVELIFRRSSSVARDCTLHTTLDPKSIEIGQLSVRLKAVSPYPELHVRIDPSSYIITLEIDRIIHVD